MTANIKHSYSAGDRSELQMLKQYSVYVSVES